MIDLKTNFLGHQIYCLFLSGYLYHISENNMYNHDKYWKHIILVTLSKFRLREYYRIIDNETVTFVRSVVRSVVLYLPVH